MPGWPYLRVIVCWLRLHIQEAWSNSCLKKNNKEDRAVGNDKSCLCLDSRYPEPQPDGAAGSTQPQQAGGGGGPLPPVAEEDLRVLLRPQGRPSAVWWEGVQSSVRVSHLFWLQLNSIKYIFKKHCDTPPITKILKPHLLVSYLINIQCEENLLLTKLISCEKSCLKSLFTVYSLYFRSIKRKWIIFQRNAEIMISCHTGWKPSEWPAGQTSETVIECWLVRILLIAS